MMLQRVGHYAAPLQHTLSHETKSFTTTGGKRPKRVAVKPPRRHIANKQGPTGGWSTPADKESSWTCLEVCERLLGQAVVEDVTDCYYHMRSIERSTKPLRATRQGCQGPVSTQPARKGKSHRMPPPPQPHLQDGTPKSTVLLSFVRSKAITHGRTGCPGTASCPGKIHDKELIEDVLQGTDELGPGQLLYSIENKRTITYGDSPFWLPFLHISSPVNEVVKDFTPDGRRKRNALGGNTVLTQDLFEIYTQITLIEENSSKLGTRRSSVEEKIKLSDKKRVNKLSVVPKDNLEKELVSTNKTSLIEQQRLLDSDTDSCSSTVEDTDFDAISSSMKNCPRTRVQDFTYSPEDYISFMPRKTVNNEKENVRSENIWNSSKMNPYDNDQKFLKTSSSVVNPRKNLSLDGNSAAELPNNRVEFSAEIEDKSELNKMSNSITPSSGTTSIGVHYNDNVSDTQKKEISNESLKLCSTSSSCQILLAYKSLNNSTNRMLTQSWLKWTGCWDAFSMLVEEMLQVKTITLYTSKGRCSKYNFPYIVIIDVLTPTDHEIQIVKSVSQRLRVERWKGFCSVYNSLQIEESALTNNKKNAKIQIVVEDNNSKQRARSLLLNLSKHLGNSQDSCSCDDEDENK